MDILLEKVETLKYAELQQLAKQFGIKANLKADKLRTALIEYKEAHGSHSVTVKSPTCLRDVDCSIVDASVTTDASNNAALELPFIDQLENKTEENENPQQANSFINMDFETSMMDYAERSPASSDPEVTIRRSITSRRSTFDVDEIKPMTDLSIHTERPQVSAVKVRPGSSIRKPKNWAAIHQRAFDKMDSLDVYMEKKQERQRRYLQTPPKRAAALSTSLMVAHSKHTEPASGIKPCVFKPSVLSTANINVNFSTMFKSPPANTASRLLDNPTTGLKSANGKRLPKDSRFLTPKETAANKSLLSTTVSTTKPVFDLKASLSKPLTYTPHKGKLKPFAHVDVKHITKAKSRDQRRAELNSIRQVQRQAALASRRH